MRNFGLIGKHLEGSFSSKYFTSKFLKESINDAQYHNLELTDISKIEKLIAKRKFAGINVTIPYKESIIPFLDELSEEAKLINAVNVIHFNNGKSIGHNTDYIGFLNSIRPILARRDKAIILGDGGAAKAIKYALKKLGVEYRTVSRGSSFDYLDIRKQTIIDYPIIINTTPIGAYPKVNNAPKIPYKYLTKNHLLFDLIYNPSETKFLAYGKAKNTKTKNGLEMLKIQAEESWKIWTL